MAGDDNTPPKPHTPNEKPFGITNIKTYIPLVLDLNELNYDSWSELFTLYCNSFGVLNIIEGTSSSDDRATEEWSKLDSLVKLWIFGTISKPLLQRVLKKKVTAHDVWKNLKAIFHDNKTARAMQLDTELRTIELGSLSITDYCHKISRMADLLANIDSPVDEKNLVTYAINGLSDKYEGVAGIIRHRDPPPTFAQTQSMLLLEESRLARKSNRQSARDSSMSSVFIATNNNSRTNTNGPDLCRNFQRGSCTYGERCKFAHSNPNGARNGNSNTRGSNVQWSNTTGRALQGPGHRITIVPTRPNTLTYAPEPGTAANPRANTVGSRGVLGPAPGQAHVVQPTGPTNSHAPAVFGPSGLW
ncbi:hypothetical protein CTI12_AA151680 [Artemisia annua]|uniref:C3H1-type domain-containing protein n=1 Tax=Artemisia annua TaxID=35608 RepID=A0A2U1PHM0_ARTAN|nr:hypothetical protein CTI12_AA151680 [Artemisia annua]